MKHFCRPIFSWATCACAQTNILWYDLTGLSRTTVPAQSGNPTSVAGLTGTPILCRPGLGPAPLANAFSADRWQGPTSTNDPGSPSRQCHCSRRIFCILDRGGFRIHGVVDRAGGLDAAFSVERADELSAAVQLGWFRFAGNADSRGGHDVDAVGGQEHVVLYLGRTSGMDPGSVPM